MMEAPERGPPHVRVVCEGNVVLAACSATIAHCETLKSCLLPDTSGSRDTPIEAPGSFEFQLPLISSSTFSRLSEFCSALSLDQAVDALRVLDSDELWQLLHAANFLDAKSLYQEAGLVVRDRIRASMESRMLGFQRPEALQREMMTSTGVPHSIGSQDFERLLAFFEELDLLARDGFPRDRVQRLTPNVLYTVAYNLAARPGEEGKRNSLILYRLYRFLCESLVKRRIRARLQEWPALWEKEARAVFDRYCDRYDARFLEDVLGLHVPSGALSLDDFVEGWHIAREYSRIASRVFFYLERFHIPREKERPLQLVARQAFAEHAYEPSARKLAERLAACFMDEACGRRNPPRVDAAVRSTRQARPRPPPPVPGFPGRLEVRAGVQAVLEMTEQDPEWRRYTGPAEGGPLSTFGSYEEAYHGLFLEALVDALCDAWPRVAAKPQAAAGLAEKYVLPRAHAAVAAQVRGMFMALHARRPALAAAAAAAAAPDASDEAAAALAALVASLRQALLLLAYPLRPLRPSAPAGAPAAPAAPRRRRPGAPANAAGGPGGTTGGRRGREGRPARLARLGPRARPRDRCPRPSCSEPLDRVPLAVLEPCGHEYCLPCALVCERRRCCFACACPILRVRTCSTDPPAASGSGSGSGGGGGRGAKKRRLEGPPDARPDDAPPRQLPRTRHPPPVPLARASAPPFQVGAPSSPSPPYPPVPSRQVFTSVPRRAPSPAPLHPAPSSEFVESAEPAFPPLPFDEQYPGAPPAPAESSSAPAPPAAAGAGAAPAEAPSPRRRALAPRRAVVVDLQEDAPSDGER
eukprot:tig00020704_g13158.t1